MKKNYLLDYGFQDKTKSSYKENQAPMLRRA